jgi:hypothetical protein
MYQNNPELNDSTVGSILLSHPKNDPIINIASSRYKVMELASEIFFEKWDDYVLQHTESHIYNHPLWFQALEHEYDRKGFILVCTDDCDNIKGVLPLLATIGLPLKLGDLVTTRRYSSLPRTPLGGLLTNDYRVKKILLNEALNKVNEKGKTFLQLKSYSSDISGKVEKIKQIIWRTSYFVELPDDPEKLRFGNKKNHHKVKWGVNKAKSLGIEVREANSEDDMRIWYKLYLETLRWHFVAVRPYRFFEFLWKNLRQKGLMTVLLAEDNVNGKKRLLSGSIFLHFNRTFFYSFNGRSQIGLASHANDLIQWEAIHLAIKLGYKIYDMGEVSDNSSSLAQFKTKWGCCTRPIFHYYYPLNEKMKLNDINFTENVKIKKLIWRKIPLSVTRQWGILTNRFL